MIRWGPEIIASDRVRFRLWAPDRKAVTLLRDGVRPIPMAATGDGWFEGEADAGPGTRYRFDLGDMVVPDPASRGQSRGVHGWSLVTDPTGYRWQCEGWRGRPWREAVIEEVHVGLEGGYAGLSDRLSEIAAVGVTAVELMPVAAFSGTRNWGYDGVLPYAPVESYGTPNELKALIDRAHGLGLMVFLDVVYNHFGPDGNYLGAYASGFFDVDRHTPWGAGIDFSAEVVKRFFIDNARMWLEEYRFDGLRFDAVHAIGDDAFLDAMARELRESCAGRHIHLILENERNDADRLREGGYDAQWNDDFHNVLHVLLTGEDEAYYADFADRPTERLARCLSEGFIYQGEGSHNHDGAPRGKPSGDLPTTRFVSFLQNHDQTGNRALGERLTSLADPDKLRAATALLLLCPQVPMLFMGEAMGSETPFLFFTDFHDELADAVRNGRRREFARFAAFADASDRAKIPDPNDRATFEASRPQAGPDAERWRALYRELIALRHDAIVPRLEGTKGTPARILGEGALCAQWRMADGAMLTIAINLGDAAVTFPEEPGAPLFALGEGGAPASFAAWLST
ncbi:malto-oligosyltrehalose trehalohydrolase [Stakelama pacifica]|uniref:Malto-oligosyltrehalose trehalohydrolase n=1 Tax=Stakelama pacifica TaxID=517720 RepID=A0A4R6FXD1_9SPHN|nr:malto-oligosyltrehalose trehalohydrolase [Stakelama pacifica]TDN86572.1 maltooligosyl trehalose hydrolase [Stakelama pacifica]GGO90040.1 malto-oligosyltrehalose trehalohydrolase [Stakelama pacifica]